MIRRLVFGIALAVVVRGLLVDLVARSGRLPALDRRVPDGPGALRRLLALGEERPAFVFLLVALLCFLLAYPFLDLLMHAAGIAPEFGFWDYGVYSGTVERWLAGESLYVQRESGSYHGSWLYLPIYLVLFRPLVELPFRDAVVVMETGSLLLLWFGIQLLAEECGCRPRFWERGVLLWALFGFQPLFFSIKQAQVSAFLAAVLAFAAVAMLRGGVDAPDTANADDGPRRARARRAYRYGSGALTAFAGLFKPTYAPVGAHLLRNRDRFVGAVVAGAVILGASLLVFGIDAHREFVRVLLWGKGGSYRHPSLWLPAYYQPFYALPAGRMVLKAALATGVIALSLRRRGREASVFALGVVSMTLIAPRADFYYVTAHLPAVGLLLHGEFERDGRPILPVAGLALLHVHSYGAKFLAQVVQPAAPYPDLVFDLVPALQPGLWGNVLLLGVAVSQVWGGRS
jgi:hypothetical protein